MIVESAYSSLASTSTTPPSFLAFLASRYDSSSVHASFDLARLKTILFLSTSSKYDVAGTKQELDEMELKGLKGLTMERVVVYGKVCCLIWLTLSLKSTDIVSVVALGSTSAFSPALFSKRSELSGNLLPSRW